jgi:hypothetical protein
MPEGPHLPPWLPPDPPEGRSGPAHEAGSPGLAYTSHTLRLHSPLGDLSYTWGRLEVEGPPPPARPETAPRRPAPAPAAGREAARRRQDLAALLMEPGAPPPGRSPAPPAEPAACGPGRNIAALRAYGLDHPAKA